MVQLSAYLLLGALSALASAAPTQPGVAPPTPVAGQIPPTPTPDIGKRATTCTFSGSGGAASASKSKTSCSTIVLSALAVPSGTTLDLTGLNKGTKVIFEGITTFGYEEWSGPLVSVSGTDITVTQSSGAYLDGLGASYWDGKGSNGGKTKPKFFYAHNLINSNIEGIYIYNPPVQVFSIDGANDLTLTDITINASAGDTDSLGHNTDGFDIGSSTTVTITGANVYNQDDCVAINSGTGITFSGGVCSGGHGLSVGSVGGRSDNVVETVTFENSEIKNSQNGIRIKTISGATGTVSGVTYSGITLSGITDYGIVVNQAYNGKAGEPTNGVSIDKFILKQITGTVESTATNVLIECGSGSCTNWSWSGVSVTGGKTSSSCVNVPSGGAAC
uniref:endo-polygalacturonase n=1 Tax=Monilinia fructicola TaxID=38448 RepID=A0A059SVE8_MONFR|nr:polygalacturonase 5 [Monilinia fructicola]